MMDHIQNNNAGSLWDKLTAAELREGPLGATGGDLVLAGAAGELDQVLVELEPDAVVAVHPR